MLALSAASVRVQLGKDWVSLHAARIAVSAHRLLVALAVSSCGSQQSPLLAVACSLAGALAIGRAPILLPHIKNSVAMALLSAAGTMPVLAASSAVSGVTAATVAAALSAAAVFR
jgi:hypothetical protein